MRKIVCVFFVVMVFASYASAGTQIYTQWTGAAFDGNWNTAGNWSNGVPQQLDPPGGPQGAYFGKAGFKNNTTSPDLTGRTVAVDQIVIGGTTGGFLTVAGGTLNISEFGNMGIIATESGILNIYAGGTINTGTMIPSKGLFIVGMFGTGVVNMNGGALNLTANLIVAQNATAHGTVNLNAGVINAADLVMAGTGGAASIVIKDGFLVLANALDLSGKIQGWIDNGWIKGAAGYTAYTAYDTDGHTTMVWAEVVNLNVLLPNGGETLVAGTTSPVTWSSTGSISNVLIEYYDGSSWASINTVANTGSYDWLVPAVNSNQCLVRISDASNPSVSDTSSAVFTIETLVTVPNVIGMTQANAEVAIATAGLAVGTIGHAFSPTVPAGNVISQEPIGGQSVSTGTPVNLVISLGMRYGGGSGTAEDPYLIYTPEQMNTIGANPADWDKHFKLMANIDMSIYTGTQYNIIGNSTTQFTGTFDGNGHKISNLTYTALTQSYVGLFGYVGFGGQIRNLSVEDVNITGQEYVGGLVGLNRSGSLTACYATGSVTGGRCVGGLVGGIEYGSITSCYATGSVSGTGIVGGLVGFNDHGATLTSCYATGSVTGVTGSYSVGGLVGLNRSGSLAACYASGLVTGNSEVGGLVGWDEPDGTLTNCYATGSVTGSHSVGGLVGCNESLPTGCFWDINTSSKTVGVGSGTSTGVTGKTTAEMQTLATFTDVGWDFVSIWTICEGIDYPRFIWQGVTCPNDLPDLEITSEDINFVPLPGEPYQPVTISATIWNTGSVAATNILVIFKDFDNQIGDPCVIPIIEPNQSATVSIEHTWPGAGFHLITVEVDPSICREGEGDRDGGDCDGSGQINESDETNNTASKLYQVGNVSNMDAHIEVTYSMPPSFTEGSAASVCGNANYKIFMTGLPDFVYPVKGGLVSAKIKDSNGIVIQTLPNRYTDAGGRFNISFAVPGKAGDTFILDVNVTDCTLTGSQNRTFDVTPIQPPLSIREFWLGGIALDNESPQVNDIVRIEATVYAHSDNNNTEPNIPVTFYAYNQSLGGQREIVGETQYITDLQRGESNSVSVQWIPTAEGVYLITAELGPGFSDDYNWNNSTSRSVIVGIFTVSANPYWAKAGDIVQLTIDSKWQLPSDNLDSVTVKDSSGNDISQDANVVHIPGSTRWIYQTTALTETTVTGRASIVVTGTDTNGTHTGYGDFYIYSQSQPRPDLYLNTCDVNVSKINPAIDETISIGATVHADNVMDVNNVPVTFYAKHPAGDYKIGSTQVIPKITQGEEGSVSIVWTNAATGIYEIEVSLGPGFSDRYSGNNIATRAVVVGEPNIPFEAEFVVVNKRRIGRTIFEYDCNVSLKNTSELNVRVLQFELVTVPNNISVTDSYVNDFEDIGPEETKTSADTCTFRVERSEPINAAQVTWKVTYEIINACPPLQQMSHSMVNFEPQGISAADITGDGKADYSDLAIMADQWLSPPGAPSADIAPASGGDGVVNFLDFAELAENWWK